MLRASDCGPGAEQFEKFKRNGKAFFQYDYRSTDGLLFSCIGKSLAECQAKAVEWQKRNENIIFGELT